MGKPVTNTDPDGWTWIFRNNKSTTSKPIHNPFKKYLEKFATFFYVTNFLDSINAKDLWNVCTPFGRLVDAFIANKRSKGGTWSINIVDENDNSQDSISSEDENELEKAADTLDDNSADDIEDIIKDPTVDIYDEVVLDKSP
ncbi:hypothetical protein Tco_0757053 [Tanacetum coccineum]|uniref:Uncharacterized protein n=1 Tax=Tanacetum coccineum TaxID=301880 RepID=A0ABQ5FBM0_9ASTR